MKEPQWPICWYWYWLLKGCQILAKGFHFHFSIPYLFLGTLLEGELSIVRPFVLNITLPGTNIALENCWFEADILFLLGFCVYFQGFCLLVSRRVEDKHSGFWLDLGWIFSWEPTDSPNCFKSWKCQDVPHDGSMGRLYICTYMNGWFLW